MALRPSVRLAFLLLLSHLLSAGVVLQTSLSPLVKAAILLLVALSLGYCLARDVFQLLPHSWRELSFDSVEVSVVNLDGSLLAGKVANGSMVCPYFIALGIRCENRHLPVFRVVFPDAVGNEEFRELCVRLRFS